MTSAKLRAIVASEHPDERHLLAEVMEREPGVVVVGQAENSLKAKTLARSLRPEVVVVDSRLPYNVGLDTVRLSRISGLDTAMDISQELPKSMVILLPNTKMMVYEGKGLYGNTEAYLYMQTAATSVPIRLRELYNETAPAASVIFANVKARERDSIRRKVIEISERATLYSGLATLGGLVLVITFVLAGAGAFLAVSGVAGLLLSLASRAIATYWPKRHRIAEDSQVAETIKLREAQLGSIAGVSRSKRGAM